MMKGHFFRNILEKDSFYTLTYSRKLVQYSREYDKLISKKVIDVISIYISTAEQ